MAERTLTTERWIFGTTYAALMVLLMLLHLVPLSTAPGRIPGPDFMLCITLAWMLRRPDFLPATLVAALFLLADLFFMRPIGLFAALVVLAAEFLRAREPATREQTFLAEWLMVSTVLLSLTMANRLILGVFWVEQVTFGLAVVKLLATVAAYPLVVLGSRLIFGIAKLSANEAEVRGRL
jgi:rod shape-determining protein MreD